MTTTLPPAPRVVVSRDDWDDVWDENTRLRAELKAARREAREWKAAHQYALETIRILSERLPSREAPTA